MGIKLERLRNTPYTYNYLDGLRPESYVWQGSNGKLTSVKEVSEEAFHWLLQNTNAIGSGELRVVEDEAGKEAKEMIPDLEAYELNTHTREQIIKILNGTIPNLKKEVAKIENKDEISFWIDVAREIGIDSTSKQKILAEKINVPFDVLFDEDSEE